MASGEIAARRLRGSRSLRVCVGTAVTVAIAIGAAVSSPAAGARRLDQGQLSEQRVNPTVTSAFKVRALNFPKNYAVLGIEGSATASGAWIVATNDREAHLFHWDQQTRRLRSWKLGSAREFGGVSPAPIAVGTNRIWLASDYGVISFEPASGHERVFKRPNEPLAKAAVKSSRKRMRIGHMISALAVLPDGSVAVAERFASQIDVITASGKVVRRIGLPKATTVSSSMGSGFSGALASSSDGTLAVSLTSHRRTADLDPVLLSPPSGPGRLVRFTSSFVTADGPLAFLVGRGSTELSSITATSAAVATVKIPAAPRTNQYRWLTGYAPAVVAGGLISYGTASGVAVTAVGAHTTTRLTLPKYQCVDCSGPQRRTKTSEINTFPLLMSTDSAGNIWIKASGPGDPIREIKASEYDQGPLKP
jgi:hypothetical protein